MPPLLLYLLSIDIFAENRCLAQNGFLRVCFRKKNWGCEKTRFLSSRAHFPVLPACRNAVPGYPALHRFDLHLISLAMERGGKLCATVSLSRSCTSRGCACDHQALASQRTWRLYTFARASRTSTTTSSPCISRGMHRRGLAVRLAEPCTATTRTGWLPAVLHLVRHGQRHSPRDPFAALDYYGKEGAGNAGGARFIQSKRGETRGGGKVIAYSRL